MKKCRFVVTVLSGLLLVPAYAETSLTPLSSPDGHIKVSVGVDKQGNLQYSVARDGRQVILASALGLQLEGADFVHNVALEKRSPVSRISDRYVMAIGKKRTISYAANEQSFFIESSRHQKMQLVFRVSDDGAAFRYVIDDNSLEHKKLMNEASSFAFKKSTTAFLQPIDEAQTGYKNTNPSYEEHYQMNEAVGTRSPSPAGWVFPALYKSGQDWVVISEANLDGSFQASRLQAESRNGIYTIGQPMAPEVFPGGALLAQTDGAFITPWRIIAIGTLPVLMESTLGTDLAAPAIPFDVNLVKPGHASWSWPLLKDDYTTFDVQKEFVDYAADMHWNYTLIDEGWDSKIGYEKMKQLADYAASKKVGILLWYNSSGSWNQTEETPKGKLLTHESRLAEFSRLKEMGIKGIKIDFFGGDGQSMIAYYVAILKDAAEAGLLVNFHGATLPRGWARTYPNLMSMEAVRGIEYTTFFQNDEDLVASHAAMLPFTRNIFDPMDFTPMVFGDIPNIKRTTSNGFELAESVLFLSGIQHFAEIPQGMASVPEYVRQFLRELPNSWDDSKFISGFPGKYVVLARKFGAVWYVAGINAESQEKTLTLDLSFMHAKAGTIITDGATERQFSTHAISNKPVIILKSHGGFVAVFN